MEIKDLLNNVYYGTLRQIAEDLVKQIDDHDNFYKNRKNVPKDEIVQQDKLKDLAKEVISVYCGEGGIPINDSDFEYFVKKNYPELFNKLRQSYGS